MSPQKSKLAEYLAYKNNKAEFQYLPMNSVVPNPFQPRRIFEEEALLELAHSILEHGVIQPIAVRALASGRYELIAGERRWRASQMAGLAEIPAVIYDVDDQTVLVFGIIENIERNDLTPIEVAEGFQRLKKEFSLTQEQIADVMRKSRTYVNRSFQLLDLDKEVQVLLAQRQISMRHALALISLSSGDQRDVAKLVVQQQLSARETEKMVKKLCQGKPRRLPGVDANIQKLEEKLTDKLKTKIVFRQRQPGRGYFAIHYKSEAELQEILKKVGIEG